MKNLKLSALLRSKKLWIWVGASVLAVVAIGGAVFLLPTSKLEITPTMLNAQGEIEPDTAFVLTVPKSMSEQELREKLTLTPDLNYKLEAQEGGYILTPIRPIKAGEPFAIAFAEQKFNFTVAKTLLVTYSIPMDGSTGVPVRTGIEFEFNQDNVDLADFKGALTITPPIEGEVTLGDGRFVLYPAGEGLTYGTTYTVTLTAPLTTPSGFALRENKTFTFTTVTAIEEATEYLFSLSTGNTVNVLSDEAPQPMVYIDERVTQTAVPEVMVKIYSYPTAGDYLEQLEYISARTGSGKGRTPFSPDISGLKEYASFTAQPFTATSGNDYNNNRYIVAFPDAIAKGHYVVEYSMATSEKDADGNPFTVKRYHLMQSTDLSVFFMQTGDDLLLWVNSVTDGKPVEGATFRLTGDIVAGGTTGADGTVLISDKGMSVADWRNNRGVFTVKVGEDTFVDRQEFLPQNSYPSDNYISYLFTDRPIYRPTDTIKVWGMVRPRSSATKAQEEYLLVMTGADTVKVKPDARGLFTTEISYENLTSQSWSNLSLQLDEEKSICSASIQIENYTKPVYTATSAPTKPVYLLGHGDTPTVNIDVSLFDGTPVPAFAGNVESWNGGVNFEWVGDKLLTNAKGRATVTMNITEGTEENSDSWYPTSYNYRYSNAEAENQNLYEYGNIQVIHRDLMLSGKPTIKDGKATVEITTNKIDVSKVKKSGDLWKENILKGVSTSTEGTAVLRKTYYNKILDGTAYDFITRKAESTYRYEPVEEEVASYPFKTASGQYTLKDIPCPQEMGVTYILELTANDSLGRTVRYSIWLTPEDENNYWRSAPDYRYGLAKRVRPEDMKLIETEGGYSYQNTWEAHNGFVDAENVTFDLQHNEKPIEEMKGRLLSTTVQNGFTNITITDKTEVMLPYNENLVPNYMMSGAYFDGRHAFILQDRYMSFNPEKRELDIKLKGDKSEYAPADTVKLSATVTNKSTGKPAANAELVVAVVDEAIFAIQEQNTDLLGTVYRDIYSPSLSKYSSYTPPEYGGAGEKGGGGGDDIRSDFQDTAFFGTAKTDANGKAEFSFTMPDNITSWRATGLALTDDNQAGSAKQNLVTTKKFFVTPVINETLIAGDSFTVGLRSAGVGVTEDSEVSYTVEVRGDNYSKTLTARGKLRDYAAVAFDPPAVGEYTVTIRGNCSGNNDAIRLPFTVIPTGVELTLVKNVKLADGIKIEPLRYPVRIELYNQAYRSYNRVLNNLIQNTGGTRSDMRIAHKYIAQIMERDSGDWYWASSGTDISDLTMEQNMLSIYPYTLKDVDLTAGLLLAVPKMLNLYDISENDLIQEGVTQADGSMTSLYLIKAIRKQISAEQIKAKLVTSPEYTLVEKLRMSTALAVLGDIEAATANYEALVTPRLKKLTGLSGEQVLYVTADGSISETDCTAAASTLATMLGHKDAEQLMLYLIQKPSIYEPYIAEQLLFLERFSPELTAETKISYMEDGKLTTGVIDQNGLSFSFSKAQLAAANFKVLSGEAYADVYYTGAVTEAADKSKKKLGITKTITPMEGGIETGKLVKITLTPELTGVNLSIGSTELIVDDYIPTGMRFERYGAVNTMGGNRGSDFNFWWLQNRDGQRLRFSVNASGKLTPIVYYARCATPGEYIVEAPYISSATADTWGMGTRSTVTIK